MVRDFNELVRIAAKLENVLHSIGVSVRVGRPNLIGLVIPDDLHFNDEHSMQHFVKISLEQACVRLYHDLQVVFILSGSQHFINVSSTGVLIN